MYTLINPNVELGTNRKKITDFSHHIQCDIIQEVQNVKYLGITINQLQWRGSEHIFATNGSFSTIFYHFTENFVWCNYLRDSPYSL